MLRSRSVLYAVNVFTPRLHDVFNPELQYRYLDAALFLMMTFHSHDNAGFISELLTPRESLIGMQAGQEEQKREQIR